MTFFFFDLFQQNRVLVLILRDHNTSAAGINAGVLASHELYRFFLVCCYYFGFFHEINRNFTRFHPAPCFMLSLCRQVIRFSIFRYDFLNKCSSSVNVYLEHSGCLRLIKLYLVLVNFERSY